MSKDLVGRHIRLSCKDGVVRLASSCLFALEYQDFLPVADLTVEMLELMGSVFSRA